MPSIEKKILAWIEDHLVIFVVLAFTVAGVMVRLPLLKYVSGDIRYFLLPWYNQIKAVGVSQQVGNYNLMYQMLIWLLTKLPIEPMYGYKLISILFDFPLAIAAAALVWKVAEKERLWKSVIAYGGVLLCPMVFLNSAAWAQCDGIYVFFAVSALAALLWDKPKTAMVLMGLSFTFKLQAVFLLPLFLFVYFRKQNFSVLTFLLIPLTMVIATLPALAFGRSPLETFVLYGKQAAEYEWMSANYPSFWLILTGERVPEHYGWMHTPAILVTVGVLAVLMICWLRKKVEITGKNTVLMAFLLAFTCVLFLPAMHERYGYLYEVLAIAIACICPSTIPLCVALLGVSVSTYGYYLFGIRVVNLNWLSVINVVIYIGYVLKLNKMLFASKDPE